MSSDLHKRPGRPKSTSPPPPANPTRRRRLGPSVIELLIARLVRGHLRQDRMSRDERARVIANLFHEGRRQSPFLNRFYALMTLSSLIAVLGLLADSTAVVIGAMIVAPLMAPVLGVAAALVMDWPRRAAVSAAIAAGGSILGIALAALAAFVLPSPEEVPAEVLARTAPNLLDLGVAVAAGSAGAYAQVRRAAGEALTGVAVAVALVPPLAVIGITMQMGEWTLAAGAVLLYLTNVAGIVLAAAATFVICGFVPQLRLFTGRMNVARSLRLAMAAVLLILAPLQLTDTWRQRRPISDDETRSAVKEVLETNNPDAAIIAIDVDTEDGERTIDITASATEEPIDVADLAEELSDELDVGFELEVTTLEAQSQKATVDEPEPDGDVAVDVEDESDETTAEEADPSENTDPSTHADSPSGDEPGDPAGSDPTGTVDGDPDSGGDGPPAEPEPTATGD